MNNNYVTLRGVGGWVRRNVTKRDRVGGWVKNGHFRRDVIMQWPLIQILKLFNNNNKNLTNQHFNFFHFSEVLKFKQKKHILFQIISNSTLHGSLGLPTLWIYH